MINDMKKIVVTTILSMLAFIVCFASEKVYEDINASTFDKGLVRKAKSISKEFAPNYNVDLADTITIAGPYKFESDDEREEIKRHVNQEYYEITFKQKGNSPYAFNFISKVAIWTDGTPQSVLYGNGYGINFLFNSYEELKANKPNFKF